MTSDVMGALRKVEAGEVKTSGWVSEGESTELLMDWLCSKDEWQIV